MPLTNIGNCWVISHPVWETRVYIGSFLTAAPVEVVQKVLSKK